MYVLVYKIRILKDKDPVIIGTNVVSTYLISAFYHTPTMIYSGNG